MSLSWKRTLRTASSERFLALRDGTEVAAIDLHYLANGSVAGTVILLKSSGLRESDLQELLSAFDDEFLPDVDLDHGDLVYSVVIGEWLGNFEASANSETESPSGAR
ncbi:MAG: hypothetical protein EAZ65_00730 [Verrucomicrobia bacterium]|nr:MAG: hypothetical protein EAZ84_05335 [Verrucomicrobiota bacterium]TAE89263.1 MAG: hypothetical protein EAZ82_01165 [Verrucomicrobiota bacterium]TAF27863.1 MAG: hypothetical protein EAZ71_00735 [Verrucomicrobiota bacterium]TAF42712.1 MAG: hypothetical protein EAZ65_00730 [Verrucomicrobiota bacterium]